MNGTPINILLVEDSLSDADLLQIILSRSGKANWQIYCSERLSEAIEACNNSHFDVALLDLSLPDSDGLETVAKFHAAVPSIPIVVFTGADDEEMALQALARGAQDYLVKGEITHQILVRTIRYAIERGQFFKQLRESQQRFQGIFNKAFQLMSLLTPTGRFLEINQTALKLFNAKPQDFIGKFIWEVNLWDNSKVSKLWLEKIINRAAKGELIRDEIQLRGAENRRIWIDFSLKPLKDETGKVVMLIAEARDISDAVGELRLRKHAETALQYANDRLQAVLNAVPGFIAWISSDLCYLGVNQTFAATFNLTPDAFAGKKLGFIENNLNYTGVITQFMASSENATNCVIDIEDRGLLKNYLIVAQKYQLSTAAVVVGIDITERKRAEVEIFKALEKERELNRLKTSFLSMVSHDFRTPLTTIRMSGELLERYSSDSMNENKNKHFKRIQEASLQIQQLLDEVLIISQSDEGKLQYFPVSLNLEMFCRELAETIQMNGGFESEIIFACHGDCSQAKMDVLLIRHILTNLLSNAVKYSPGGKKVWFDCICRDNLVTFVVKDSGIGIPLKDKNKLFEAFHRGSNVGRIQGTGLGLAIVKKCVEVHQGHIDVKSQEGEGTTFTVSLPLG